MFKCHMVENGVSWVRSVCNPWTYRLIVCVWNFQKW